MGFVMKLCIYCALIVLLLHSSVTEEDLYRVLGVKKSATAQEIKKAYKSLAKEWHPDKNRDPGANDRFMKINEAYETLSDQEKRAQYDQFGTTAGDMGQSRGQGGHHGFHGFEQFFQGSFQFGGGQRGGGESLEKFRMTIRTYDTKVVPESATKPYLIYAYADFCFQCMQVEMIWDGVRADLETIGIGVGTVHVHMDQPVSRKLKLSRVPAFVAVVNGKPVHYNKNHFSVQGVRDFIRTLIPNVVTEITDKNYQDFLDGWRVDNRVRMIFCDNSNTISLRFLYAAFASRDLVLAGYAQTNRLGATDFIKKYNIKAQGETLLMFNEQPGGPAAQVNMKTIPRSTMDQVIDTHNFLLLPRLSSQDVFNQLCPPLSSIRKKKLCVVLLAKNIPEHTKYVDSFREYAIQHQDGDDRVKYAYIWEDTQRYFVHGLTKGQSPTNDTLGTLKVAVIWRKDQDKMQYDWLEDGWYDSGAELKMSRRKLHRLVDWALQSGDILPFVFQISQDLTDENRQALLQRILTKLYDWYEASWDKIMDVIGGIDEVTLITAVSTVMFIMLIGYLVRSLVIVEEERYAATQNQPRPRPRKQSNDHYSQPTVNVHPLCLENFEDLTLRCERGVRTIVVLVDEESRHKILQHFVNVLLPYSRSGAFNFAFLQLENYLPWYKRLLEYTLDNSRSLNINMKNCIGTVLAINGPRKYYCIYHAQAERMLRKTKKKKDGDFLGLDDGSDDSSEGDEQKQDFKDNVADGDARKLFYADLMSGFGMWMERLVEGTLPRFRVDVWPNMARL